MLCTLPYRQLFECLIPSSCLLDFHPARTSEELTPGAKYEVYALKDDGTRHLIADFVASSQGKGSVALQLRF